MIAPDIAAKHRSAVKPHKPGQWRARDTVAFIIVASTALWCLIIAACAWAVR